MTKIQKVGAVTEYREPSLDRVLRGAPNIGISATTTGGAR